MRKTDDIKVETPAETGGNAGSNDDKKCCRNHCRGRRCGGIGRLFIGILVVVGVVSIASSFFGGKHCYAGSHHWKESNMSERMEHMSERLMDKVDATDEQETQIKAILKKFEPSFKDMRSEHQTYRDAFLTALQQDTVNQAELEQIRANMLTQVNEKSLVLTEMITEVAHILTPEQRKALAEDLGKHSRHW